MPFCQDCGKEMIWMEFSEVWACPDDCNGFYAIQSFFRLGVNLSPNPKYKDAIRWKTPEEIQSPEVKQT